MRFFFSYLWRSPLIRLATMWFLIGVIGIVVFMWRLTGMREELVVTNQKLQAYIAATQQIEEEKNAQQKSEIDEILEEIERYRPTVEELLNFVKTVENIAEKEKVYLFFHTVNSTDRTKKTENFVTYKLGFSGSMEQIKSFLSDFETLNYAIDIQSMDVSEKEDGLFVLRLIFILHTKLV